MNDKPSLDISGRLAVSIDEAAVALGIHRVSLYRLIKSGKLRTVKLGGRRIVPVSELRRLLGEEPAACAAPPMAQAA